jgi:hypothetical protein
MPKACPVSDGDRSGRPAALPRRPIRAPDREAASRRAASPPTIDPMTNTEHPLTWRRLESHLWPYEEELEEGLTELGDGPSADQLAGRLAC